MKRNKKLRLMTEGKIPIDLWERFIERHQISVTGLGEELGFPRRTIQRWKNEKLPKRYHYFMLVGLAFELGRRKGLEHVIVVKKANAQLRTGQVSDGVSTDESGPCEAVGD